MMRHMANTGPIILNIKATLIILIAGPAYKKVKAGPVPQPRFNILEKRGTILQEQVGSIIPAIEAIGKANNLLAFGPRNLVIE